MLSWRWRLGPARFGSYKTPGGGGFRIYRPSSVRRLQLGSCDCCHRLLFEYPSFFGRPICASRSRLGSSWSCRFTPVAPWQVLTRRVAVAGRGAYSIRALPDLCFGIRSEGLERVSALLGVSFFWGGLKRRSGRGLFL